MCPTRVQVKILKRMIGYRIPAAKRIKKEPEDDVQSVTQDEPKVETTVKPWEDKKDYEAIFRKYISIGDDGEEHYDVIDMERDAQRAVTRITDHQEIVKQYLKVVRAYKNFMRDYPRMTDGLIQDNCRFGRMRREKVNLNLNWEGLWVSMQCPCLWATSA